MSNYNQQPFGFNPGAGSNYPSYPPSNQPAGYPPQTNMPSASPYPPQPGYPPAPVQSHNPGWFGNAATAVMAANAFHRPTGPVGFNAMQPQSTPYPSAMPVPAPAPAVPPMGGYPPQPAMGIPSPAPHVGMPPAPGTGMPPAPSVGMPPVPSAAMPPAPSVGMPPAPSTTMPTAHAAGNYAYPANPMPAAAPVTAMPAGPTPVSTAYTTTSVPPTATPSHPRTASIPSAPPPVARMAPAPVPSVPPPAKNYNQKETPIQPQVAAVTSSMAATKISKVNRGTVKDYAPFSADADAELLKKAMKGFGCDEKAIIFVMYSRSHQQRQQIIRNFKTLFGKDLVKMLKNELSGKVEDIVMALLKEPAEVDAHDLRKAMKGLGTTESTIIEIVCSRSNQELADIKAAFKKEFDRDLEKDIYSETSGHFRNFLVALLQGNRSQDQTVNTAQAAKEAKALYDAGEARWGTDESKFKTLLAARSFPQLRAIFQEYSKICKYTIDESIKREMSGDLMKCMLAVTSCAQSVPNYLAQRLNKALTGGLDSNAVIRIVVTRSEVDMEDIKAEYLKMFGKRLEDVVEDKLSSSFKRVVLGLLGARE